MEKSLVGPRFPMLVALTAVVGLAVQGCLSDSATGNDFDLTCTIASNRLFSGGVSRDGIPALTDPNLATVQGENFLDDDDRVLGVEVNGAARAYPLPLMWWHEIVNDTLGGENVLVTYCPLTGSGIAFEPNVGGQVRNFAVSGLLFENNLMMFDRQTESLWNQMLLGSQCGPERGTSLQRKPITETTWRHWKNLYPATTVVTYETGVDRAYGAYPYQDYDDPDNPRVQFPTSGFSLRRPPKELNYGIFDGQAAVVFPFGVMEEMGAVAAINDSLNAVPFLVTWVGADSTATAFDRRVNGQELTFSVADSSGLRFVDAETGTTWDIQGSALSGQLAGEKLRMLEDAYVAFWFAWDVYYPALRLVE